MPAAACGLVGVLRWQPPRWTYALPLQTAQAPPSPPHLPSHSRCPQHIRVGGELLIDSLPLLCAQLLAVINAHNGHVRRHHAGGSYHRAWRGAHRGGRMQAGGGCKR